MKHKAILILIVLLLPSIAISGGGQIYGNITVPAHHKVGPVPLEMRITCQGRTQNAYTDNNRSYRLFVPGIGECSITVFYLGKWTAPYPIYVTERPIRYNFVIMQIGSEYALQRN